MNVAILKVKKIVEEVILLSDDFYTLKLNDEFIVIIDGLLSYTSTRWKLMQYSILQIIIGKMVRCNLKQ